MTGSSEMEPFVYSELSRPDAEERLRQTQATDGDFLVRVRDAAQGDYTLVVVYKGSPTHHVLRLGEDGTFTVNKLPCGGARSLVDVVEYFSRPVKGWPVVLKRGITRDPPVDKSNEESPLAPARAAPNEPASAGPASSVPTPLQPPTPQENPAPRQPPGAVFVPPTKRATHDAAMVLISEEDVAMAREKAQQDEIRIEEELAAHDAKMKEEEAEQIKRLRADRAALIRQHRTSTADGESFGGFGQDDELGQTTAKRLSAARRASAARAWEEREEAMALVQANVADTARVTQVEADANSPSYLWRVCTKKQSADFLTNKPDGTFLMRKTSPPTKDSYLLDIVFKGKRTTHAVASNGDGVFTLNSKVVGQCRTIDDIVFRLRRPLKNWPIVLVDSVVDNGKCKPRIPGARSPEDHPDAPSYLWPETARIEVENLLAGEADGTFHVRSKKGATKAGSYLLSVQFRDKPTQHSIERSQDGVFVVNEKPMGNKSSLDDLIEYLRVGRKTWPVRLTSAVRAVGVLAPVPERVNASLSERVRTENCEIGEKLGAATATLQAALARIESGSGSAKSVGSAVRGALAELDIRTARGGLIAAESALEAKQAALRELRAYAESGAALPGRMVEIDPNNPSYLWHSSATDTKARLSGAADGTFLVRSRIVGGEKMYLGLVFQGNVTTHELALNDRQVFTVNGKAMGGKSTIDGVISYLSTAKRTAWPVILQTAVRNPDKPMPESEAVRLAAADVAAAEVMVESARLTMALVNPDVRMFSRSKAPPGAAMVDTRAIALRRTRTLLADLENELHQAYQTVLGTTVPVLNRDHSGVLLTVMGNKVAEELRKTPMTDTGGLHRLYSVALLQRRVKAVREHLDQTETAMAVGLDEQIRERTAALTQKIEAIESCLQKASVALEAFKKQKAAVDRRVNEATDKPEEAQVKLAIVKKEIEKASVFCKNQDNIANELRVIRSHPILSHFYQQVATTTRSAFRRVQAVYNRRHKAESNAPNEVFVDGVSTASGFLPLGPMSSRSVVGKLCDSGVLRSGGEHGKELVELCAEFARVTAYRYQDQIRLLSAFDAKQFAQWFAVPLIRGLVHELPRPPKVLIMPEALQKISFDSNSGTGSALTVSADGVAVGSAAHSAGLRPGDVVVALNGTPCRTVDALIDEIARVPKGSEVALTIAATESAVPSDPAAMTPFLVRLLETSSRSSHRVPGHGQSTTAGAVEAFYDVARPNQLIGGSLCLYEYAIQTEPADLLAKSGTSVEDGDEVVFFHSPEDTAVEMYGYRRSVPSVGPIYRTPLAEFRQLGWSTPRKTTGPPSFASTTRAQRKSSFRSALSIQATETGQSTLPFDEPLWNPVETIALAKTAEVEELAIQVLQLKREVEHLNQVNGQLNEQLATSTGTPLPVKFRSSLHGHKKR